MESRGRGPLPEDAQEIANALRTHVLATSAAGRDGDIFEDDDLLATGVIDSMGVMELISFVEEKFDVLVDDEEIVPDNFRSIAAVTRLVAAKKGIDFADRAEDRFRAFLDTSLPEGSTILVVSDGHEPLLRLDRATGWHFPRDEAGRYMGNPSDSAEAITQVEHQRALGATHIAFPRPALWWLQYYDAFADHLTAYGEIARGSAGVIYSLQPAR
jgi:acyl carrier protein